MTISRLSRALSLLLAVLLCVGGLAGCGGSPFILRLAVSGSAGTFDPQYAADDASKLVAANVFEGLLVEGEDGILAPGVAESYTVSADGRTYTFTLREDAAWSDGTPVTAADFVFALRRLFTPGAESPYAENLLAVENAAAILAGEREPSALGVRADGDRTLVLTLSTADDGILSVLAQWYCAPCNEAFFTAQRGRYGLEMDTTLYNTRYLRVVRRRGDPPAPEPELPLGQRDGALRGEHHPRRRSAGGLPRGQSAVAPVPAERLSEVADAALLTVEDTTYALLFNTQSSLLGNSSIRLALAASPDREQIAGVLTGGRVVTNDLVPDAAAERGQNYRDAAGGLSALTAGEDLYTLFREGLAAEGETRLPFTELLVPDTLTDRQAAGIVQGCWQDTLGASLNVMPPLHRGACRPGWPPVTTTSPSIPSPAPPPHRCSGPLRRTTTATAPAGPARSTTACWPPPPRAAAVRPSARCARRSSSSFSRRWRCPSMLRPAPTLSTHRSPGCGWTPPAAPSTSNTPPRPERRAPLHRRPNWAPFLQGKNQARRPALRKIPGNFPAIFVGIAGFRGKVWQNAEMAFNRG